MSQHYSEGRNPSDAHTLPDLEVFYAEGGYGLERGWYWWACFPGCLPDGDPCGPFDSEKDATHDAHVNAGGEETCCADDDTCRNGPTCPGCGDCR